MSNNSGPYVEQHGRLHRVTLDVYVPEDVQASREELIEWLEWELKVSSEISQHNPYYDRDLNGRAILDVEDRKRRSFTEWDAAQPDGSRTGRHKTVSI